MADRVDVAEDLRRDVHEADGLARDVGAEPQGGAQRPTGRTGPAPQAQLHVLAQQPRALERRLQPGRKRPWCGLPRGSSTSRLASSKAALAGVAVHHSQGPPRYCPAETYGRLDEAGQGSSGSAPRPARPSTRAKRCEMGLPRRSCARALWRTVYAATRPPGRHHARPRTARCRPPTAPGLPRCGRAGCRCWTARRCERSPGRDRRRGSRPAAPRSPGGRRRGRHAGRLLRPLPGQGLGAAHARRQQAGGDDRASLVETAAGTHGLLLLARRQAGPDQFTSNWIASAGSGGVMVSEYVPQAAGAGEA